MGNTQLPRSAATDLEAVVLGVVWRDGPCTPYAIRQHFRESPAPRWSGSAGAIYPLLKRLEDRGWVKSTANATGRRRQLDYSIAPPGKTILSHWLATPNVESDTALLYDPLRARLFFLDLLPPAKARTFVATALEQLHTHLRTEEAEYRNPRDPGRFTHLAVRNGILLTRARIRWLREVADFLDA